MKTRIVVAVLALLMFVPAALAWGPATHVYIVRQLQPNASTDMAYGAIAPDLNQALSSDQYSNYFYATHYDFMDVWSKGKSQGSPAAKDLAYGFISHNEQWGADHTAHIASLTQDPGKGYVIQKAELLCAILKTQVPPEYQGILTTDNCHFVLEYGIDLMIRKNDPQLAAVLNASVVGRNRQLNPLFMSAYAAPYGSQFAKAVVGANDPWRQTLYVYSGILLENDDQQAVEDTAVFLVGVAKQFGILPPSLDDGLATQLIGGALQTTMSPYVCGNDYKAEVDATVQYVKQNLQANGVQY